MMSLKEASEIVASAPCPHCAAMQYFNVMQLGQNLVCSTCSGEYGAPAAPGARASKTLWGPRPKEEAPAPAPEPAVDETPVRRGGSQPILGPVVGVLIMVAGILTVLAGNEDGALNLKKGVLGIAWIIVGGFFVISTQLAALIRKE